MAPARDGARYIRQALDLDVKPAGEVIRESQDHPGYALLLNAAFRAGRAVGLESPRSLVLVAQVVSAACGLALIVLAYLVAKRILGLMAAGAGLTAFVLLPRPANHLSDVLSDPLHAALWMGAALLVIVGLGRMRILPFFLGGLAAGMAYWVRIDALTLPASTGAALAFLAFAPGPHRWPLRRAAGALGLHLLGFGLLLGAFVAIKGELSGEGASKAILGDASAGGALLEARARSKLVLAGAGESIGDVAGAVGQEVQFVHLVFLGVAVVAALKLRRLPGGAVFIPAASVVYALLLFAVRDRAGYVAGRYALPLVALLVPLGLWGIIRAGLDLRRLVKRGRRRKVVRVLVALSLAISVGVSLPSFLGHRPHDTFHGVMRAGEWVRDHSGGDGRVVDPYFFPTFVAGMEKRAIPDSAAAAESGSFHAIAQDRDLGNLPGIRSVLESGRAREVAVFPRRPGGKDTEVRVYEVAAAGK